MVTPTITSLRVVEHKHKKMFLVPDKFITNDPFIRNDPEFGDVATASGLLKSSVGVGYFTSYSDNGREVDTPYILFRKGEYLDHGHLSYLFGQDSGYLVWNGCRYLKNDNPKDHHRMHADWFEIGDIITLIRMPHPNPKKQ